MDEIKAKRVIAEQLSVSPSLIREDAEFCRHLKADSLDVISLTMALEEAFDVRIADDEAERCQTVGDALNVLRIKLKGHC